jgi:predicted negative regulator of RcsB-dependent stress response
MAILTIKRKTVENPFQIQGLISVLRLHHSLAEFDFKVWNQTQMNQTQLYSKQYMQIQEDSQTSLSGMRVNLRLHHSFAEMFRRLESKDEPSCTLALENRSVQIQKKPH